MSLSGPQPKPIKSETLEILPSVVFLFLFLFFFLNSPGNFNVQRGLGTIDLQWSFSVYPFDQGLFNDLVPLFSLPSSPSHYLLPPTPAYVIALFQYVVLDLPLLTILTSLDVGLIQQSVSPPIAGKSRYMLPIIIIRSREKILVSPALWQPMHRSTSLLDLSQRPNRVREKGWSIQ